MCLKKFALQPRQHMHMMRVQSRPLTRETERAPPLPSASVIMRPVLLPTRSVSLRGSMRSLQIVDPPLLSATRCDSRNLLQISPQPDSTTWATRGCSRSWQDCFCELMTKRRHDRAQARSSSSFAPAPQQRFRIRFGPIRVGRCPRTE